MNEALLATEHQHHEDSGAISRRRHGIHAPIRDTIREMVISGRLGAGARIDEKSLSEELGVSKTPIREALKVLASEGLVELLPNRGSRVIKPSREAIQHLFSVIAGLERLAAEIVARDAPQRDIQALSALHENMSQFFANRQRESYFELNHQIHETIITMTRNPVLVQTHSELMTRARRPRFIAITSESRWQESIKEHSLLMAAIELRDSRIAGEILYKHVLKTGETYLEFLNSTERAATR